MGVSPPRSGEREPTETKEFDDPDDAREWLFGAGLQTLPWPISRIELFSADGKLLWSEWHWGHPALQDQIQHWWRKAELTRHKRIPDFRPVTLVRLTSPEHHPDASDNRQIITTYPDRETRMGTITRSSEHSWTIELATKRWTFESEEACKFCVMGFEEGTGRPPRTMTLMQFLTLHAPDEHAEAFKLGKDLGESFVQSHHGDETRPGLTKDAEVSRPPNPFFEVHVEIDGKKGGLVFELEGNKEEVDEVLQTADYAVKRMAENASETPQEFAKTVLRTLPSVASRKDDADPQRLMHFAALYMIKTSPKWRPDRMIRNCSLWLHDDQVDVYITYIDHPE